MVECSECTVWLLLAVVLAVIPANSHGGYSIPPVKILAFSPKGFKASIPAVSGIQRFVFHMNIGEPMRNFEPGKYTGEVTTSSEGEFAFYDPNIELKVGDKIHYWVYVQYASLGYRRGPSEHTITSVSSGDNCPRSFTIIQGKDKVCSAALIFEDDFVSISPTKWKVNQYLPFSGDFEFNSYEDNKDVTFTQEGKLFIKPILRDDVYGTLNFPNCTSTNPEECYGKAEGKIILPPVISAKLSSKLAFTYGKIEVKAKLPKGDWIYPQIQLKSSSYRKIFVAYARGNEKLTDPTTGEDWGCRVLYGGPVLNEDETKRTRFLAHQRSGQPFATSLKTYTLLWTPSDITLSVDGEQYGKITTASFNEVVQLELGVGVGGINDFPDGYLNSGQEKPWKNDDEAWIKNFYKAKTTWHNTWDDNNIALQVESVKIWAI